MEPGPTETERRSLCPERQAAEGLSVAIRGSPDHPMAHRPQTGRQSRRPALSMGVRLRPAAATTAEQCVQRAFIALEFAAERTGGFQGAAGQGETGAAQPVDRRGGCPNGAGKRLKVERFPK